jgi:hypothetical protein
MKRSSTMRRVQPGGMWLLLVLPFCSATAGWSGKAQAGEDIQACFASSAEGQKLELAGKLRLGRAQFVTCAAAKCPKEVADDCAEHLAKIDKRLGSIVVSLRADGKDVSDARVLIDGEVSSEKLDGQPIMVEPGKHKVRIERTGAAAIERDVDVAEGAKLQPLAVTVETPPPPATSRPIPVASIALGAVGLVGLGCFAGFGIAALGQSSDLHARAPGTYSQSDVDSLKTKRLIADVSLGVGVVGVSLAAAFYFMRPAETKKDEAVLDVRTLPGGAMLTWASVF